MTDAPVTIVAVHAHPDDESIFSGLALAKAARLGHKVYNVTCTLGEEGEVIGDGLARLVTTEQRADGTGLLGGYRLAELQRALQSLDLIAGPIFLGGVGRWRDSGMENTPTIAHPRAFANPDKPEAFQLQVAQLIELFQKLQPDIVITYDPEGGYGHPDHKQAHKITHAAVEQLDEASRPKQLLWCVNDRQAVEEGLDGLGDEDIPDGWSFGAISTVNPDQVSFTITGEDADIAAKAAAMAAHATQVIVDGPLFAPVSYTHLRAHETSLPIHTAQSAVSYTHLTLPTTCNLCRSRWSPYH